MELGKQPKREIRLKVGEIPSSAQSDIGIGIVRIDLKRLAEIGVKEGHAVEIEGSRKTAAIAIRPYPSDVGLDIIRMDGYTRRNAGTSIGESVVVRKAELKEAKKIVLAPAQKGIIVHIPGEQIKRILLGRVMVKGDMIVPTPRRKSSPLFHDIFGVSIDDIFALGFGETRFVVVNTDPKGVVKITERTHVEVLSQAVEVKEETIAAPVITYEDIGGLSEEIRKVREMIELPLKHPELFERLGIEPPKGVLLYGPPGTGKTLLAKAVANESGAHFISINGPEVTSKWYGESEKRIREIFKQAQENAPSIIFIDEIDAIAPKREEVSGEVERRIVAQLLASMDGLEGRGQVIVIGATNRPDALDPALRRPGRFDREIEIGVPDRNGRKEILQIHTRNMPLAKDVDLNKLADITHGYVGADISALVKEAAMYALRRILPEINLDEEIPPEVLEKLQVSMEDFRNALMVVEPSAMREVMVEVPKVSWQDVGGLEEQKQHLREMVEWPLKHPDSFKRMGIKPPKGVLLYGPPGTGKTLLAKAVANESEANFIYIKGPEIFSKWVGESEKRIREIFRKARQVAPAIIFIDEIDAVAPKRGISIDTNVAERVVNQLLSEMDGLEGLEGVIVIGATNRPDALDPALMRPGRFDRHIYVPIPDKKARLEILKVHTRNMPLAKDVDLDKLSSMCEGYTGADIEALCREAAIMALRENLGAKEVRSKHFKGAMKVIRPSLGKEELESFKKKVERIKALHKPEDLSYFG